MLIRTVAEVDAQVEAIRATTASTMNWVRSQRDDPLAALFQLKFKQVGRHPVLGHTLNFIEQVNQTWTYLAALQATRLLLTMHPDADGFTLAPGAHASQPLDVMSVAEGLVGAETFAAVHPRNNGKLKADLKKLAARTERHRYVFFISPAFAGTSRRPELESSGVEVWSLAANS